MVTAYQLYYDHRTRTKIDPLAVPVDTTGVVTPYFESYWIANLPLPEAGYVGVFSPEFHRKTRMPLSKLVMKARTVKADVIYPAMMEPPLNLWMQGAQAHPFFFKKARIVLEEANLSHILRQPTANIFCNYFLMPVDLFREFREEWMKPVMLAMDKLQHEMDVPCNYRTSSNHNVAQLKRATGFYFYTYRPFICERLIGSFAHLKNLNLYKCH